MKEYQYLDPKIRQPDAYVIKPHVPRPTLVPRAPKSYYRILDISEDGTTATICANMKVLTEGKLSVIDIPLGLLRNGVFIGDILSFESHDSALEKPVVSHRFSQRHQHPSQLIAQGE